MSEGARQYLAGLMQGGGRKNMLHMAEVVPECEARNLQQFLTHSKWDARAVMDQVAQQANAMLGDANEACLLLDESGFSKQGKGSVGVARQWLGCVGKVDNGQVGVFGVLCNKKETALVDARLYLPKEWIDDPKRCRKAGVPESEQVFRTKDELAVEIIKNARKQGLKFGWVGADAGYGKSPETFHLLSEMKETFFIDVPSDFSVYLNAFVPVLPSEGGKGRPAKRHRTMEKKVKVSQLKELKERKGWRVLEARDTTRGPLKLRSWSRKLYVWDGIREEPLVVTLVVTENLDGSDRKYTLTNAPEKTPLKRLVYQARQRYWVERAFEDAKGTCGMKDYQVRKWSGWHHHMALVMLGMLFMSSERHEQKTTCAQLSCRDIEILLARFLPRRDMDEEEVIRQVIARHRLRDRAKRSHTRCAESRGKPVKTE